MSCNDKPTRKKFLRAPTPVRYHVCDPWEDRLAQLAPQASNCRDIRLTDRNPSPFSEQATDSERLIWAPEVHEYFGETCFFYLLRVNDAGSGRDPMEPLTQLLESEGLDGQTVHGLFGFHDLLVRVWTDESGRRRFLRGLRDAEFETEDISEFRVEEVWYRYAEDPPDQALVADPNTRSRIAAVLLREADGSLSRYDEAIGWLEDRNLIHVVPPQSNLRVYVLLEARAPTFYESSARSDFASLRNALGTLDVTSVSLYRGVGRLSFILKFHCSSFDELYKAALPIYDKAHELGYRTTTLPVPSSAPRQIVDRLRIEQADPELERLISELDLGDERQLVRSLSRAEQTALIDLYRASNAQVGDTPFRQVMNRLLRALLMRDEDELSMALAFLTRMESTLRNVLFPAFHAHIGSDWHRIVATEIEVAEDNGRNWTLSTLLLAMRFAWSAYPSVASEFRPHLHEEDLRASRDIVDLRNSFSHGTIYRDLEEGTFAGRLGEIATIAISAGRFFVGLERVEKRNP